MSTDAQLSGGERVLTFLRLRRDTHENWSSPNAIQPKNGEVILVDYTETEDIDLMNQSWLRIKIGDGVTSYSSLPFVDNDIMGYIQNLIKRIAQLEYNVAMLNKDNLYYLTLTNTLITVPFNFLSHAFVLELEDQLDQCYQTQAGTINVARRESLITYPTTKQEFLSMNPNVSAIDDLDIIARHQNYDIPLQSTIDTATQERRFTGSNYVFEYYPTPDVEEPQHKTLAVELQNKTLELNNATIIEAVNNNTGAEYTYIYNPSPLKVFLILRKFGKSTPIILNKNPIYVNADQTYYFSGFDLAGNGANGKYQFRLYDENGNQLKTFNKDDQSYTAPQDNKVRLQLQYQIATGSKEYSLPKIFIPQFTTPEQYTPTVSKFFLSDSLLQYIRKDASDRSFFSYNTVFTIDFDRMQYKFQSNSYSGTKDSGWISIPLEYQIAPMINVDTTMPRNDVYTNSKSKLTIGFVQRK